MWWTVIRTFWRLFGVYTADLSHDRRQRVYSAVLMATCVHSLCADPETVCGRHEWCANSTSAVLFDRAVAVTTLLSRAAIVCAGERHVRRYARVVASLDALAAEGPGAATRRNRDREEDAFAAVVVSACLVAIVPVNVARLSQLVHRLRDRSGVPLLVRYAFMYAQNLSMCCLETQFACQCYAVYARFRDVNDGLGELRRRAARQAGDRGRRPSADAAPCDLRGRCCGRAAAAAATDPYRRPRALADVVELLRVRHWMVRQAADALNALFGLQMGLAVFLLWAMALLDVYYELFKSDPFAEMWIYCWLSQYALRLFVVIMVSHYTTKQALYSRVLITDTNNEILDNSTKEEVMAAGATYLVVLVQFHNLKN